MRIYRNHIYTDANGSEGYTFHASKREAEQEFSRIHREQGSADLGTSVEERRAQPIEFKPTMRGILRLLNNVAGHNDNG